MSRVFRFLLPVFIIINIASAPAQERVSAVREESVTGSLADLRDKQRVWIVVRRSTLLDARDARESVLSEVYRNADPRQSFPRTFNLIARKLNKYIKSHRSLSAARSLSEAEFIIFFNVLEIRRPLGTPYAYGELYVILNVRSKPRIIWKTRSNGTYADDAIGDLLAELKATRGEK
jgi:hypothetical protein